MEPGLKRNWESTNPSNHPPMTHDSVREERAELTRLCPTKEFLTTDGARLLSIVGGSACMTDADAIRNIVELE